MRLIDADALGVGKANREVFTDPLYADGWNSAIELINQAPTIDAVEVVRCKDCKSLKPTNLGSEARHQWYCARYSETESIDEYWMHFVVPDHFCAQGVRRDGGEDDAKERDTKEAAADAEERSV